MNQLPPHSLSAERSVLGSILLDNECLLEIRELLDVEDFYRTEHRSIFSAMIALEDSGAPIDLVTLPDKFRNNGNSNLVPLIAQLAEEIPTTAGVLKYAEIIKAKSSQRKYDRVGLEIRRMAREIDSPGLLQAEVETAVLLAADKKTFGVSLIHSCSSDVEQEINQAYTEGRPLGLLSGFNKLDNRTGGFKPGELWILGARPGMGKTAFALQVAFQIAEAGNPVGFFSLEMDRDSLLRRLACYQAGISYQRLVSSDLDRQDLARFFAALRSIRNRDLPFYVDDSAGLKAEDILTRGRRYALRHKLKLIIVDYLQLATQATKGESLIERTGKVSGAGKELAKRCGIPVLMLSQLNRSVETQSHNGESGIPLLSNLRDSGNIEQDADVVLCLWRGRIYSEKYEADEGKFLLLKQRNGPTGQIDQKWNPAVGCWEHQ